VFSTVKIYALGVLSITLVAGFFWYRHTLIMDGEQKVDAAVTKTTAKLEAANAAKLAAQAKTDADNLQTIETSYAKSLTVSNANTAGLAERVRQYEAARSRSLAVPGESATSAGPDAAAGKPDSFSDAVQGLAEAASHDADTLVALQQFVLKECR